MKRKPIYSQSNIIDRAMLINIVVISLLITVAVIIFFLKWYVIDLEMARTGVLLLLVGLELMRVQMIRSDYGLSILSNKWLIGALVFSLLLVLMIIYTPLSQFFATNIPSQAMWIDIGIFISVVSIIGFTLDHIIDRILKVKSY